jgi:hypothetical protein
MSSFRCSLNPSIDGPRKFVGPSLSSLCVPWRSVYELQCACPQNSFICLATRAGKDSCCGKFPNRMEKQPMFIVPRPNSLATEILLHHALFVMSPMTWTERVFVVSPGFQSRFSLPRIINGCGRWCVGSWKLTITTRLLAAESLWENQEIPKNQHHAYRRKKNLTDQTLKLGGMLSKMTVFSIDPFN